MIVDVEIDVTIVEAAVPTVLLDHEERRRLHAAPIATLSLSAMQRGNESVRKRTHRGLEAIGDSLDDLRSGEDVSLCAVVLTRHAASPLEALGTGVGRDAPARINDAELPLLAIGILREETRGHGTGIEPFGQKAKPIRSVARVGPRLGRDRADGGTRPRHDGADREELRLHGDADLVRRGIEGTDREGHANI